MADLPSKNRLSGYGHRKKRLRTRLPAVRVKAAARFRTRLLGCIVPSGPHAPFVIQPEQSAVPSVVQKELILPHLQVDPIRRNKLNEFRGSRSVSGRSCLIDLASFSILEAGKSTFRVNLVTSTFRSTKRHTSRATVVVHESSKAKLTRVHIMIMSYWSATSRGKG